MSARRSHARSRRRRRALITLGLAVAAAAFAAYLWRSTLPPSSASRAAGTGARMEPPKASADNGGEDFSAAERQGLEEVLKHRGASKQP